MTLEEMIVYHRPSASFARVFLMIMSRTEARKTSTEATVAPMIRNWKMKRTVRKDINNTIITCRKNGWSFREQLIMFTKFEITFAVPKSAPFIQRRRCFINAITLPGASVTAFASGTYYTV